MTHRNEARTAKQLTPLLSGAVDPKPPGEHEVANGFLRSWLAEKMLYQKTELSEPFLKLYLAF